MKHITVVDKSFRNDEVLIDVDIDKCLIVTDDAMALIGIRKLEEIVRVVDLILENVAMKMTGLDVDEMDEDKEGDAIRDSIILESQLALNLAAVSLTSALAVKSRIGEETSEKMADIGDEIIDIVRKLCDLSPAISAVDPEEYRRYVGRILMNELDEWEKKEEE